MTVFPSNMNWEIGHADEVDPAANEKKLFDEAKYEAIHNSVLRFVAAYRGRLARAMNTNDPGLSTFEMVAALESKRDMINGITKGHEEVTIESVTDELMDTVYAFSRHAEVRGKRSMVVDALKSIQPIKI